MAPISKASWRHQQPSNTLRAGFFDATSPFLYANPYKGANPTWAGHAGQDFVLNHDSPNVDYAVMHLWVSSCAPDQGTTWHTS